jgi:hypothetical protein
LVWSVLLKNMLVPLIFSHNIYSSSCRNVGQDRKLLNSAHKNYSC